MARSREKKLLIRATLAPVLPVFILIIRAALLDEPVIFPWGLFALILIINNAIIYSYAVRVK